MSSVVPAVPWMVLVLLPLMAAESSSDRVTKTYSMKRAKIAVSIAALGSDYGDALITPAAEQSTELSGDYYTITGELYDNADTVFSLSLGTLSSTSDVGKYPITAGDFPFEERARKAAGARNFELKVTKLTAPNYFEPDRQVVKRLTEVSNRVLDRQDVPFVMSGGTYARKLPNALAFGTGMELPPAPEGLFRPGHGDYHQPDESIRLLRIEKALEVYICSLLEIDSLGSLLA